MYGVETSYTVQYHVLSVQNRGSNSTETMAYFAREVDKDEN